MATKKKSTHKKLSQKVQKIIKGDVKKSVALASLLLNILFLVSIFVLTATDTFDRRVYVSSRNRYCSNMKSVEQRAKVIGNETAARQEQDIDCMRGEFAPFYTEALQKYQAQVNKN